MAAHANQSRSLTVNEKILPVNRQTAVKQVKPNDPYYGTITSEESNDLTRIATYKGVDIQMRDIYRLQPEKYLNDNLIDFGVSCSENVLLSEKMHASILAIKRVKMNELKSIMTTFQNPTSFFHFN